VIMMSLYYQLITICYLKSSRYTSFKPNSKAENILYRRFVNQKKSPTEMQSFSFGLLQAC
jgi:hypothetical protein